VSHKIWIEGCTQQEADAIADMIKTFPGVKVREVRPFQQATPHEVKTAQEVYGHYRDGNEIEVDDDAGTSEADDGTWVQAWLWLYNDDLGIEDDEEDDYDAG
jgi:hypothetical protein